VSESLEDSGSSPASAGFRDDLLRSIPTLLLLAIAIMLPASLVVAHVHSYPQLSPVDELQHIDYYLRSPTLIVLGDRVQEPAMREQACRGIDAGIAVPSCDAPSLSPSQFQENGFNTAYIHPPTYYSLTALLSLPLRWIGLEDVTAGRLVGVLWLSLGLLLSWIAGRRLRISAVPLAASLLLVGVMPSVVYSSSVINPDAVSMAVGAAVVLLTLEAERRTNYWRWILLAFAAIIAIGFKSQNFLIILCLALYLLLRAWQNRREMRATADSVSASARRPILMLGMAIALGLIALLVLVAWLKTVSYLGLGAASAIPMNAQFKASDGFPFDVLANSLGIFFPPSSSYFSVFLRGRVVGTGMILTGIVLVAGCTGVGWFLTEARPEIRALARAVTITAVLGAPFMVIANDVLLESVFLIPPRYGLPLLPAMALCVATGTRSILGRSLLAALAVSVAGGTLAHILVS